MRVDGAMVSLGLECLVGVDLITIPNVFSIQADDQHIYIFAMYIYKWHKHQLIMCGVYDVFIIGTVMTVEHAKERIA